MGQIQKLLLLGLTGVLLAGPAGAAPDLEIEGYDSVTQAHGIPRDGSDNTVPDLADVTGTDVISTVRNGFAGFLELLRSNHEDSESVVSHAAGFDYQLDDDSKLDLGLTFKPKLDIVQSRDSESLGDRQLGWQLQFTRQFD